MNEFLQLMWLPFVACLILTGIHAYLGLHVIERGVIFVDLALAQMAAFGATLGLLLHYELHSTPSYLLSLGFALAGAAVFAATRFRKPIVPQEAIIGIAYALAAAAAILVLSRAPEGGEELKALLVGHLLFVEWQEVLQIGLIYLAVGALHGVVRRPLLKISADPAGAFAAGMKVRAWDFLFYASFGFVVTSSVELAGVLLVFSFLVVPAVCGVLLARTVPGRLLVGWLCGMITSVAGIGASYRFDLPTGATVVCMFGVSLLACAILRAMKQR
jgi:zinc/manganese transport system permease protein